MAGKGKAQRPVLDPHSAQQLDNALKTLSRSGAAKYFYHIRKRPPGQAVWPYWRRALPTDEIDDVREYCYSEGGDDQEYKIEVRDGNGGTVRGPGGEEIIDSVIPAMRVNLQPPKGAPAAIADPILEGRRKELETRRMEFELERQETELERQRRRLEKVKQGQDPDEDDEEGGFKYYQPRYLGPGMPPYNPLAMQGNPAFNPYQMNPWPNQQRPQQNDMVAFAEALGKIMGPRQEQRSSLDDLLKLLPILKSDFSPKEMAGMFSPFVLEMAKASSDTQKVMMQGQAEMDRSIRERMLDMVMADPNKGDDDIERWRKMLGLGSEAVGKVVSIARAALSKGRAASGDVNVPLLAKKNPPGIPSRKGAAEEPADQDETEAPKKPSPVEAAQEVVRLRVQAFLTLNEQEMLVGSDEAWAVEKLDELWASFPQILRAKLLTLPVDKIYEELKRFDTEIVDRILAAVADDKTGSLKNWCLTFWDILKTPPEDEEEDDGRPDDDDGRPDEDAPEKEEEDDGRPDDDDGRPDEDAPEKEEVGS
jgi:hypothetical protein